MFHDIINGQQPDKIESINPAAQCNSDQGDITMHAALNDFYAAFNQRDVDKSVLNWAQHEKVVMCNPMGGIRRGISSIREGYQTIMQGSTRVYVEFYDYELVESDDISYVAGRERGYARRDDTQFELDIRTSRIYQRIDGYWRQIHHHGSMTDAKALQQYQAFLNAHG